MLPFSAEQFIDVFRQYNEAVWPFQIALKVLGAAVAVLLLRPRPWSNGVIAVALTVLWVWTGVAYHLWHFSAINPAADVFGAGAILAGALFAWHGPVRGRLRFEQATGVRFFVGTALIVYALLVYPQLSGLFGHHYPFTPTFGVPCPTTIFTVGVLVFMSSPYPRSVLVIPVLWCALGSVAGFALGMLQDLGLLVAGGVGAVLAFRRQAPSWRGRGL
jgi:hypothetical protein